MASSRSDITLQQIVLYQDFTDTGISWKENS